MLNTYPSSCIATIFLCVWVCVHTHCAHVAHMLLYIHRVKFVPPTHRTYACKMSREHTRICRRYLYNLIIYSVTLCAGFSTRCACTREYMRLSHTRERRWPCVNIHATIAFETTENVCIAFSSFFLLLLRTIIKRNVSNVRSCKLYYGNIVIVIGGNN